MAQPCVPIALLLLLALVASCSAELVMVYAVVRHGARNVLPKSANLTESEATGGPALLPQGRMQASTAGAAFRQRYIAASTCDRQAGLCLTAVAPNDQYGLINSPRVGFTNYNTLINSSALDRTLVTGNRFMEGVFPGQSSPPVPIYSVQETEDYRIRGYTRCPSYQRRLTDWYASDEFKQKEVETQGLRQQISDEAPQLNTSLANWWNVYDAFNVWRTYRVGDVMPDLDNATYGQVMAIAHWLEVAKMRSALTGSLLGGPLLADILGRLGAAGDAWTSSARAYYRLLAAFGHYNTQLGLLAALSLDAAPGSSSHPWFTNKIPSPAAVLAFELHCTRSSAAATSTGCGVRLVIQDGAKGAEYEVVPLPCTGTVAGLPGACPLQEFVHKYSPAALTSAADWCEACDNQATNACRAAAAVSLLAADGSSNAGGASSSSSSSSSRGDNGVGWKVAVAVLTSVVGTAALCAAGGFLWYRRHGAAAHKYPMTLQAF